MIGHGFMGAAHSQAWRTAPRFFDLDAEPEMTVVVGRDPDRTEAARAQYGWQRASTDWRAVVADPDIDVVDIVSPGLVARRGRHRRAAGRQARALREAPRQHRRRGRGDGRRRPRCARARRPRDGRVQLPPRAGDRVRTPAGAGREDRDGPPGPRAVPAGLADRRGGPDDVAPRQGSSAGSGSLGDIGAHAIDLAEHVTGAQLSPCPARSRPSSTSARCSARAWDSPARRRPNAGRSPSTTPRSSPDD